MNELQEYEDLLRGLLQAIQEVIASGEVLSDEFQGEIAKTLGLLWNRIEALRSPEVPTTVPETAPPNEKLKMSRPFGSSNVHSFGYDPKTQKLYVKFQGDYPQQNGPVYQYEGVNPQIFDIFRKGSIPAKTKGHNAWGEWWKGKQPSLGASLYALISSQNYPYQRIS